MNKIINLNILDKKENKDLREKLERVEKEQKKVYNFMGKCNKLFQSTSYYNNSIDSLLGTLLTEFNKTNQALLKLNQVYNVEYANNWANIQKTQINISKYLKEIKQCNPIVFYYNKDTSKTKDVNTFNKIMESFDVYVAPTNLSLTLSYGDFINRIYKYYKVQDRGIIIYIDGCDENVREIIEFKNHFNTKQNLLKCMIINFTNRGVIDTLYLMNDKLKNQLFDPKIRMYSIFNLGIDSLILVNSAIKDIKFIDVINQRDRKFIDLYLYNPQEKLGYSLVSGFEILEKYLKDVEENYNDITKRFILCTLFNIYNLKGEIKLNNLKIGDLKITDKEVLNTIEDFTSNYLFEDGVNLDIGKIVYVAKEKAKEKSKNDITIKGNFTRDGKIFNFYFDNTNLKLFDDFTIDEFITFIKGLSVNNVDEKILLHLMKNCKSEK